MNLLICGSRGIPANYGGFESLVENLVTQLKSEFSLIAVTGFSKEISKPVMRNSQNVISYILPVRGPVYLHNLIYTWKAVRVLDQAYEFDSVLVLNDVNFFVARRYLKSGVKSVLHLDGAEQQRLSLPKFGKFAHRLFRLFALRSEILLVADSNEIKSLLKCAKNEINVISYAPNLEAPLKPYRDKGEIDLNGFLVVVARFVPENQIIEILRAYIRSKSQRTLVIVGLGTGTKKYEEKILKVSALSESVFILPKNYYRGEINWLLANASAYIHGHSVGGTNPILIDARYHAKRILCHDNPYNREGSGSKELFWSDEETLSLQIGKIDKLSIGNRGNSDYHFETWERISNQYLKLLTLSKSSLS